MAQWQNLATCLGMDSELFFPIGNTGTAKLQAEDAKRVCGRCPVLVDCREWSLLHLEHGVAGGMTEDERSAEKRRRSRRKVKHPTRPADYVPSSEAAEVIRKTRLTNRQVADRSGLHEDAVSNIRRGVVEWVHVDTLKKLKDAFEGVKV